MALDAVVEDILATSKGKVAQSIAEATKRLQGYSTKQGNVPQEIKSRKETEVGHAIEAMERREISSAHLEVKRSELNVTQGSLEQVRAGALERVRRSSPRRRMRPCLKKLLEPYNLKDMKVYSNKRDEAFVSSLAPNYGGNLDIIGGVVVESKDGALRYDLTYETLAREVFNNHMKEVSRILFG